MDTLHHPQQRADREKIELFLCARKLINKDLLSESDPKCKVFYSDNPSTIQFKLIGQTEVQKNNLNPNWKTTFEIDYIFEIFQQVRFEVWDYDKSDDEDMLGLATCSIGEIMGATNQVFSTPLKHKKTGQVQGQLFIKAERVKNDNNYVLWQWKGHKLMNTDGFFGKSDPFLRFFRQATEGQSWLQVHETEFIKDTLEPVWKPFEFPCAKLDGSNPNKPFRIECWDNSKSGKHNFIGEVEIKMTELIQEKKTGFVFHNPNKKKPGKLKLIQMNIFTKPSFIDYLQGGEQINMAIAVDFTGSNGDPKNPNSLHSVVSGKMNQYQTALYQVSQILLNYDHDKKVPMYGFGGVPRFPNYQKGAADHCFPLTGSFEQPEVNGLQGIMDYYTGALQYVELSGPTYFAPIIEYTKNIAEKNVNKDIYTVLLILTDGEIHDMEKTASLISNCARIPLSIIIIGVGNEKFDQMKKLDGDDGPLKQFKGGMAYRDLVQFVAFKDHIANIQNLATEVLHELPNQLVAYKKLVGQQPKQHQSMSLSQVG